MDILLKKMFKQVLKKILNKVRSLKKVINKLIYSQKDSKNLFSQKSELNKKEIYFFNLTG